VILTRPAIILAWLVCFHAFPAVYSGLIATTDGGTVYIQAKTGFGDPHGYVVQEQSVQPVTRPVADIDASGAVVAASTYGERYCGSPGSTCFLAAPCSASVTVQGPGIDITNRRRPTTIRLDRSGTRAWIDQQGECRGLDPPAPAALNGLYELPSMRLLAAARGAVLANQRHGRRLITESGRVLTFAGIQLQLLDASGARAIRHVAGAVEAVIDASGANVVYAEDAPGALHWIDLAANLDENLGLTGSAPALSDDGRLLAYLDPSGTVQLYDRASRTVRALQPGVVEFTLSGNGQAVFAATNDNRLLRIAGETSTWLDTFPEITSISSPQGPAWVTCPLYCYGTPDPPYLLGRTALVALAGRAGDVSGWRARAGDREFPLHALDDGGAWFQVSGDTPLTGDFHPVEIYNPAHPLRFTFTARVDEPVVTCFGTLHQDFSRLVTEADPALPGEYVHIFLTGLRGTEQIPDGEPNPTDRLIPVANPPALPEGLEVWFFGLAPGYIGLQQLDVRVSDTLPSPLFPGCETR